MRYINKIGYEIEGVWRNNFGQIEDKIGGDFTGDGSLEFNDSDADDLGMDYDYFWDKCEIQEYRSNPRCSIGRIAKDLSIIKRYFKGANESCGFHIHVSFKKDAIFSCLASKEFTDYFVKKIAEIYPAMFRDRAGNHFCMPTIRTKKEVIYDFLVGEGNRYKAVNFNARVKHSTVEFRIFDMNINDCLKYIKSTIMIIQNYLDKALEKNRVIQKTIPLPITKKIIYV